MSHALDSVTETSVSGPKKSMRLEQPVRGRGQGAGADTSEQLGRGDVRNKVLGVLRTLMQHIFALPFVKIQTNSNVVVEDNNIAIGHNNRMFLDDVCENIQNGSYEDIQDVMNGINEVFDQTVKSDGNLDFFGRKLCYKSEDIEFMAAHLRKELEIFHATEISALSLRRSLSTNGLSEIIREGDNEDLIFTKLKARYENVPEYILLAKALDITLSQKIDIASLEAELQDLQHEHEKKYKIYKFYPSRQHDFDTDKVHHSYIAGYQFHKMITKTTSAPIAMRTILNMSDAIESITYIENDESTMQYEEQRKLFKQQGKVNKDGKVDEMLLFHGTAISSLDNILASNFVVDAIPVQQNTMNETRKKTMMFGRGVYFSEMPSVSLMYGNGLLLCKVMLGSCEVFRPQGAPPPDIPDMFDSREIQTSSEQQGVIHVVKNPVQILPYCVIQLKSQSLTTRHVKPCMNTGNMKATCHVTGPRVPGNSIPNSTVINKKSTAAASPAWNIVPSGKRSEDSGDQRFAAAETVSLHTTAADGDTAAAACSVCQESLGGGGPSVALARCGHTFHADCLVQVVEHQPGRGYVQCPNCQAVHGEKTGNMPGGGQMLWTRQAASLPGHPDCGLIVIKYTMTGGTQGGSHPNPGKPYSARSFPRHAFLPDNAKGGAVLQMLMTAFQRGLTFTIGRSLTRAEDDCVIWNGIHHKTLISDNGTGHGYPDPGYLDRVVEELRQHGVYPSD